MFKRCKVVMLPTEDKKAYIWKDAIGHLIPLLGAVKTRGDEPQHLHILSDDEIKEGDYVCPDNFPGIWVFQKAPCPMPYWGNAKECQKVIATTDSSFSIENRLPISEGRSWTLLPQPSQSFIDKYVSEYNKGNIIIDVMVEYTDFTQCKGEMEWYASEPDLASPDIIDYYRCKECGDIRRSGAASILSNKRICGKHTEGSLKVNPNDNTITIKKLKDSWTKDEVIEICKKLNFKFGVATSNDLHKWIETNLN